MRQVCLASTLPTTPLSPVPSHLLQSSAPLEDVPWWHSGSSYLGRAVRGPCYAGTAAIKDTPKHHSAQFVPNLGLQAVLVLCKCGVLPALGYVGMELRHQLRGKSDFQTCRFRRRR